MKVKDLKKALDGFDDDMEVMVLNQYRQEIMPVNFCKMKYETLDKKYVYIG